MSRPSRHEPPWRCGCSREKECLSCGGADFPVPRVRERNGPPYRSKPVARMAPGQNAATIFQELRQSPEPSLPCRRIGTHRPARRKRGSRGLRLLPMRSSRARIERRWFGSRRHLRLAQAARSRRPARARMANQPLRRAPSSSRAGLCRRSLCQERPAAGRRYRVDQRRCLTARCLHDPEDFSAVCAEKSSGSRERVSRQT